MEKSPKRRKYRDNPYTINKDGNKYYVSFKDILGIYHEVEITEKLYLAFNEFELKDLSFMNEYDNHIEHSEVYENNLEKRAKEKIISVEDDFIKKATFEELKNAIEMLPEIQKRRVKKYYFEEKNEYLIAKEENTTHQAVHIILERAIKNLKRILKNFN